MAYLPKPGRPEAYNTTAAVAAGQAVSLTGPFAVAPSGAASGAFVGVAAHNEPSGGRVIVYVGGLQRFKAASAINAGATVTTAAAGTVAAGTTNPIGVAATTAAAGETVAVRLDARTANTGGGGSSTTFTESPPGSGLYQIGA